MGSANRFSIVEGAGEDFLDSKKVESECNEEGISEEEDSEEGTLEDDEEDNKEGESEDECVLEEKTRTNISMSLNVAMYFS
ncbi:hypothetical protein U1Q18_017663, partial [Sarracenia purpurea var. burkii]